MINVERIFNLDDTQSTELERRMQAQYGPLEPIREINEVFSPRVMVEETFSQLGKLPLMPSIQIRTIDNEATLTYRRKLDYPGRVVSHELGISSRAAMSNI